MALLISLLTGRVLLWAQAIWNPQNTLINCIGRQQLIHLHQGSPSRDDYTLQFRTLAISSGWNKAALLVAYRQGLNPQILAMMPIYDDTVSLESFMQKAVKISQCLTACQLDKTAPSPASPVAFPPVPEPMQVDSYCLTHRTSLTSCLGLSLLWGFRALHQNVPFTFPTSIGECPPGRTRYLYITSVNSPTPRLMSFRFSVRPPWLGLLWKLHLPRPSNMPQLPREKASPGAQDRNNSRKPLGRGRIKYRSPPVSQQVGCFHHETISFLVLEGPTVDIVLRCPWPSQHSPEVRWDSSDILWWSEACLQNSLSNVPSPPVTNSCLQVNSILREPPNPRKAQRSHLTTQHSRMC